MLTIGSWKPIKANSHTLLVLAHCYRQNVCVPSKFTHGTLIPRVMVLAVGLWRVSRLRRQSPHKWGSCPYQTDPDGSLAQPAMQGHREKMAVHELGSRCSPDTSAGAVTSYFPASRTVRNSCVVLNPPSLWYFCYGSPKWLSHQGNVRRSLVGFIGHLLLHCASITNNSES